MSPRSLAELERHAALMEMLSQVSRVALEDEELPRVLRRIVGYIAARLPVGVASILLLDESCSHFVMEVSDGELELEPLGPGELWPATHGVVGRAVRTGEAQLITDVRADPDYLVGNPLVRSEYIVPIRVRDRLLGVLNLESAAADTFSPSACRILDQLALQIAGAIHVSRVNQRLAEANRELENLSQRDGLTGLPNRRTFDRALAEAWEDAKAQRAAVSVLLADLDHFKALNDAWGHLHGDECLRRAAACLAAVSHREDVLRTGAPPPLVARFGGEEFAVLLRATRARAARAVAEALRLAVTELRLLGAAGRQVTISIGVATAEPRRADPPDAKERLLEAADRALYRAKDAGRNRVEVAPALRGR